MAAFTTDDPDTYEIDDGISFGRVSHTENWLHVHIANPVAFIPEDHWVPEIAMGRSTAHYLPDKFYVMLSRSNHRYILRGGAKQTSNVHKHKHQ